MLIVDLHPTDASILIIKFNYYADYIRRIKMIDGAVFIKEIKAWTIPNDGQSIAHLESLFDDELVYKAPEWIVKGIPKPSYIATAHEEYLKKPFQGVPILKLPLMTYQQIGVQILIAMIYKYRFAICADDVGLGKTCTAIAVSKYFNVHENISKMLIVCKKSLRSQWQKDGIDKFLNNANSVIVSGTAKQRMKIYTQFENGRESIMIVNYQTVMNDYEDLKRLNFQMIIIDEAHEVATREGVMNNALGALIKHNRPKVLFLTGTPIMSTPEDIFGIVQMADPHFFVHWDCFKAKHIIYDYSNRYERLVGYRRLSELKEAVQSITLRRTEHEVDVELPEMTNSRVSVDQDDTQKALSAKLKDAIQKELDSLSGVSDPVKIEKINTSIKLLGLSRQVVADDPRIFNMSSSKMIVREYGDMVSSKYVNSPKTEALIDLVKTILHNGDKVIIFTKFERAARLIVDDISYALKTKVVAYTGAIDDETRDANVQAFWLDPDVTTFVATDAGSVGLNLQVAKYVINYDQPDNPGLKTQRFGRVRRIGSNHKHVHMYDLITIGSMDEDKLKALEAKESLFGYVVGLDDAESDAVKKQLAE